MFLQALVDYKESKDSLPYHKPGLAKWTLHLSEDGTFDRWSKIGDKDGLHMVLPDYHTQHNSPRALAMRSRDLTGLDLFTGPSTTKERKNGIATAHLKKWHVLSTYRAWLDRNGYPTEMTAAIQAFIGQKTLKDGIPSAQMKAAADAHPEPDKVAKMDNIVIRIGDAEIFYHEEEHAQEGWIAICRKNTKKPKGTVTLQRCLVCNQDKPIATQAPQIGKTPLLSTSKQSYQAWGFKGADHGCVCTLCMEKAVMAIDLLMGNKRTHWKLGKKPRPGQKDNRHHLIAWCNDSSSDLLDVMHPDTEEVQKFLARIYTGSRTRPAGLRSARFYMLLFSLLGRRFRPVYSEEKPLAEVEETVAAFFSEQTLADPDQLLKTHRWFGVNTLCAATVPETKDLPDDIGENLLERALFGRPLSPSVHDLALDCLFRSDKPLADFRIALLNLIEADRRRSKGMVKEDTMNDPLFICGRVLAKLEELQYRAVGKVNKDLINHFLHEGCVNPRFTLQRMVEKAHTYLPQLRRDHDISARYGMEGLDSMLHAITENGGLPRDVPIHLRHLFVLGVHWERHEKWLRVEKAKEAKKAKEADKALRMLEAEEEAA